MIVLTNPNELKNVLECIAPDYPRPYLDGIENGSGQCTYICNGETVVLIFNDLLKSKGTDKLEDDLK